MSVYKEFYTSHYQPSFYQRLKLVREAWRLRAPSGST